MKKTLIRYRPQTIYQLEFNLVTTRFTIIAAIGEVENASHNLYILLYVCFTFSFLPCIGV